MALFLVVSFYTLVWPDYPDGLSPRVRRATHEVHAGPALLAALHRALRPAAAAPPSPAAAAAASLAHSAAFAALLTADALRTGASGWPRPRLFLTL